MKAIGSIGGLWRYPVKSLYGEALEEAPLDDTGIIGDRRWALRSVLDEELVNCKAIPSLLTMGASYQNDPAPGYGVAHAVITLPDGRQIGTDDPQVEAAVSAIAGRPLTLWPLLPEANAEHYRLRQPFSPEVTLKRMGLKPDDPYPDFSTYEPEMIEELEIFFSPRGSYKDAYPLHFITSASLETVKEFLPGVRAEARRFRPNFLIDTVGETGLPELDWTGYDLVIGDNVVLHCGQKTVRCIMPSQPQLGLEAEPKMGGLLQRLANMNFGAYCFIRNAGTIKLGDKVYLDTRKTIHQIKAIRPPLPEDPRSPEERAAPLPSPFAKAKIVSKKQETPDVVSIGLKLLTREALPFLPGQHLILACHLPGHERPVLRSYSISSAPSDSSEEDYQITAKRIGLVSSYLHDGANIGDEVEVRYPSGRFFDLPVSEGPLVLLSNGIGVTPLFSMLKNVATTNPARKVFWLHATDNSTTHLFRDEINKISESLESFKELIIYRHPNEGDVANVDYHSTERIKSEHLRVMAGLEEPQVFICGTEAFINDSREFIQALGIADAQIHTERFHVQRSKTSPGKSFSVRFERSGIDSIWESGDLSLLEIAEDLGIQADFGCRYGACEVCSVPLVEGEVGYADPDVKARMGEAYICCAEPQSDIVLDL